MTKFDLEHFMELSSELLSLERSISRINSHSLVPSPNFDGVHSSQRSDKVASRGDKIVDLCAERDRLTSLINEIQKFAENAPPKMRKLLQYKWIDDHSWEETLKLVGGASTEAIKKSYYRFMKKLGF